MSSEPPRTPRKQRQRFNSDVVCSTPSQKLKKDVAPLSNYTLGDCLGRGAYATVYRALNLGTGETVAVKQIRLVDVSKADLDTIMMEIDLLKNLNHPNIVKYHGFVKTSNNLSIILEYCENGSLSHICRKFGKFPENLVAVYIYQVLQGLAYLHQQGTIHRDIKGANILTTKDGLAKLADFGVATKINRIVANDQSVVGTPNWMAPEVIELNGATTASDIWSLGCTIVELLTGKPPYHNLRQMPALFAIVNDETPPIPEGLSPQVHDFLLQCFQKDPNLRVTAKNLLKHPWMLAVKTSQESKFTTAKYDDAVRSVQQWNDAIQQPVNLPTPKRRKKKKSLGKQDLKKYSEDDPFTSVRLFSQSKRDQLRDLVAPAAKHESWDADFDGGGLGRFESPKPKKPTSLIDANSPFRDTDDEDFSDLEGVLDVRKLCISNNEHPVLRPSDLKIPKKQLDQFVEKEDDENDYSSIFGDTSHSSSMVLQQQRVSSDSSIEDAFAVETANDDMAANAARDRLARAHSQVQSLVDSLNANTGQELNDTAQELLTLLQSFPDCSKTVVRSHGLLPILEVLDQQPDTQLALTLFKCLKEMLDETLVENFVMIGGLPTITKYASRKYSSDIRVQAASLVKLMYDTEQSLRMLISCGGLSILTEFVEEDVQHELVTIGIDGLWNVFQLDSSPRNDLCRILARHSILDSLVQILEHGIRNDQDEKCDRIVCIFTVFSQTEAHVRESIANRSLFRGIFKCYFGLNEEHQLSLLKFIKSVAIPANFQVLQNSNTIEMLVEILTRHDGTRYKEVSSQVLHILFNLCRLSPERQQEAALSGVVPILQSVVIEDTPLKQFALPILCDLVYAGKKCQKVLWNFDGLSTYLYLAGDPSWQVNAYEAIAKWLTDEQARVEDRLVGDENMTMLLNGLDEAKTNSLNTLLEAFLRILQTSQKVCRALPLERLLKQVKRRMKNTKPITKLNLLRMTRCALESHPERGLLKQSGLISVLGDLTSLDNPVLVRELASDLLTYASPKLSPQKRNVLKH